MISILLVDDYALVRAGIQRFLRETAEDIEVTDEAATADAALRSLRSSRYDLVLLDIALPDKNGIEVLKHIRRSYPDVKVLILSMHPESRHAVDLLRHGAHGYLQKDFIPEELVAAIRTVHQGRRYITPALAELLAASVDGQKQALHKGFSPREKQISMLLAEGQPVSAIAEQLHLSMKTVTQYRNRILEKLQIHSIAELTRYALLHNLMD